MTLRDHDPRRAVAPGGASWFSRALNLVGILVVAYWAITLGVRHGHAPIVWALSALALAGWIVRAVPGTRALLRAAAATMVIAGAIVTPLTDSILIVPVILGIIVLVTDPGLPIWAGVLAGLGASAIFGTIGAVVGISGSNVLGDVGGVLLGILIGISRRQFRDGQAREREAERQAERTALLAERSRAARDIHDVLAHSLGGLVLQLDAVEALLDDGQIDQARDRAAQARTLAADGLAEARRAVRTLRDDAFPTDQDGPAGAPALARSAEAAQSDQLARASVEVAVVPESLRSLIDAHRGFGGAIAVDGDPSLPGVDDAHAAAVVAVAREALTNARKHAPGTPVSLSVIVDGDAVDVVIANPLRADGNGIVGMRERFAELGTAATIEAEESEGEFVVAMHVPAGEPGASSSDPAVPSGLAVPSDLASSSDPAPSDRGSQALEGRAG
ncbi:sensor histidine kinase [Curtobacterium ammoniigenes]|uniref:sensor histidine kinase n=1 Tax=Curtobacterium ammoniigenes TaxID=395387 RepID=UPI00082BC2BE|nr:histidine kinase [Curtobacterium ammoniigenes]